MDFLFVKGNKPRCINLRNVLYLESREAYSTSADRQKVTVFKFMDGSSVDVAADIDKILEILEDVGNIYEVTEDT